YNGDRINDIIVGVGPNYLPRAVVYDGGDAYNGWNPPTKLADYLAPNVPASPNAGPPQSDLARLLSTNLGLIHYERIDDNWSHGAHEKGLKGDGGRWYFIPPHDVLYRWDGSAGARGIAITKLFDKYYQDPGLLAAANGNPMGHLSYTGNDFFNWSQRY